MTSGQNVKSPVFASYLIPRFSGKVGNHVVFDGVQMDMGFSWTPRRMQRCACVSVAMTLQVALAIGGSKQQSAVTIIPPVEPRLHQTIVKSTPIEKALDELGARFPNRIVIGFEELFDPRPDKEPQIDLGPTGSSLAQVLNRIRIIDPKYRVELLQGGLVHVYPAKRKVDPVGLLDIRLREFSMPQDSCLGQAIENFDSRGYARELSKFLAKRKEAWYRKHGGQVSGVLVACRKVTITRLSASKLSWPVAAKSCSASNSIPS